MLTLCVKGDQCVDMVCVKGDQCVDVCVCEW